MGGRSQLEGYRIFGKPRPYLRSLALRDALFCEPGQARDGAALSRIACALRIRGGEKVWGLPLVRFLESWRARPL